jgi:DNA-directed RNA polymerase subunit RPC12/RpoP
MMPIFSLTDKSKNLITTKVVDGKTYALCDKDEEKELWILLEPLELPKCIRCGYEGAGLDRHHVHGRKNSDETVYLCSNCHRELHAGEWSL